MLTQPLLHQLHELRLRGMAAALEQQLSTQASNDLTFDERLALLIQHELVERQSCRLRQRLRWAKLTQHAALEDLDLKAPRGLDRAALGQVTDLGWIGEHLNVLITGPTGVGKSYLACAVGHAACRADYSVRFFRIPRLIDELARYAALQNKTTLLRQIAKADLLIIDLCAANKYVEFSAGATGSEGLSALGTPHNHGGLTTGAASRPRRCGRAPRGRRGVLRGRRGTPGRALGASDRGRHGRSSLSC